MDDFQAAFWVCSIGQPEMFFVLGMGFRLPFAVQSKGSLKTNECGIIMNAGENIGSLKWLPRVLTACWQAVRWQKLRVNVRLVF